MKRFKILLTTCLIICIAATACVLGACTGDDKDNKEPVTNVTVTVLLDDNTPAVGVKVNLCAIGENGLCLAPQPTGSDGKVILDSKAITTNEIKIQVTNVPDGYIYADANGNKYGEFEGLHIPNTQNSVTITLKKAA